MLIKKFKQILSQDFANTYEDLVTRLGFIVNPAFDTINNTLNQNVSLKDNIFGVFKEINVIVDTSGNPLQPIVFSIPTNMRIAGFSIINAVNQDTLLNYPTSQPFIIFQQNGNTITINNIKGLQANEVYTLTIQGWGR